MAFPTATQGAIAAFVLLVHVFTYFLYRLVVEARVTSPLPPPTEITKLFIYPVKSCHGIEVPNARLLPTGLDLDRQWMFVTFPDYKFLTIRGMARMTLIRPSYNASTDVLTVMAPAPDSMGETPQFSIPAHPTPSWLALNTTIVHVNIWDTTTPAHCYSTSLTAPFNVFFGKEVRLVYKSPTSNTPRPLGSNGHRKYLGRDASTCFPDLMPVLVGCESSINELNARLKATENLTIDVRRFRPNILVRGHSPWSEDRWKTLTITSTSDSKSSKVGTSGLTLDVTQRCARCHVPNVDPETGKEHKRQPWDMLMKYRRVDEGIKYKPCFGMLCVPRGDGGMVETGMQIAVKEVTDKHRYIVGF